MQVDVWTVNDEARALRLFERGVGTLITDRARVMRRLRDTLAAQ